MLCNVQLMKWIYRLFIVIIECNQKPTTKTTHSCFSSTLEMLIGFLTFNVVVSIILMHCYGNPITNIIYQVFGLLTNAFIFN